MARRPFRATKGVQLNAKELRQQQTEAEAVLWDELRNRRFQGLKFRRQHPIDGCVVDFYCAQSRLVVEIDGPIHERLVEQDEERQAWLEGRGCRVIRFSNDQVNDGLTSVLTRIVEAARHEDVLNRSREPTENKAAWAGPVPAVSPSPTRGRGLSDAVGQGEGRLRQSWPRGPRNQGNL